MPAIARNTLTKPPANLVGVQPNTGHHTGRKLTPKPAASKLGKSLKNSIKPSATLQRAGKPKPSGKTRLWWNKLSLQEQLLHIKKHPRSKLKPTHQALSRPRAAADSAHKPRNRPNNKLHGIKSAPPVTPKTKPEKVVDTPIADANNPEHWQHLHKLFKHVLPQLATPHHTNKLIAHVEANLTKKQHKLLGEAHDYAQAHPELEKPPHKFRKVLGRVLIFAILASAGGVLAGPAGVLLVTHFMNEWKNKTGGGVIPFAWNALKGNNLDGSENKTLDKTERPAVLLIKSLKLQLEASKNKADKEHITSMIEDLENQLEEYTGNKSQ